MTGPAIKEWMGSGSSLKWRDQALLKQQWLSVADQSASQPALHAITTHCLTGWSITAMDHQKESLEFPSMPVSLQCHAHPLPTIVGQAPFVP